MDTTSSAIVTTEVGMTHTHIHTHTQHTQVHIHTPGVCIPMSCCRGKSAERLAAPRPTAGASLLSWGGPAAMEPSLLMLGTVPLPEAGSCRSLDREEEERARLPGA